MWDCYQVADGVVEAFSSMVVCSAGSGSVFGVVIITPMNKILQIFPESLKAEITERWDFIPNILCSSYYRAKIRKMSPRNAFSENAKELNKSLHTHLSSAGNVLLHISEVHGGSNQCWWATSFPNSRKSSTRSMEHHHERGHASRTKMNAIYTQFTVHQTSKICYTTSSHTYVFTKTRRFWGKIPMVVKQCWNQYYSRGSHYKISP